VGCGNGMLLKMLDENFGLSSQTGMEYAKEAIEVARQVNPDASYLVHDITSPYPERFDAVVSTEVLEHILRPIEAIKNMLAMMGDGGVLLITVPNGRNDTFSGHINFWSPESWEVFIEENSGGLEFVTGGSGRHLLYALIRKGA
jgi:2-polyprenyl-3-methyl-5-hydroxy-6-metoxy-1,4-benzoquinol methylase